MSYLLLNGDSGAFASSPDATPIDTLGDIDIRIRASMFDWTPGAQQVFACKWGSLAAEDAWIVQMFSTDRIRFNWTPDGVSFLNATATAATAIPDGGVGWLRVTFDADNGAAGRSVRFFKAADETSMPGSWTQIGSTVTTAGVTSIQDSTGTLQIGASAGGTVMNGKIYRVQVRSNILDDGTGIVYDADFSNLAAGQTTFNESSANAAVVTLNGKCTIGIKESDDGIGNYGDYLSVGGGMSRSEGAS